MSFHLQRYNDFSHQEDEKNRMASLFQQQTHSAQCFWDSKQFGVIQHDQLPSPIFHHPHQACWRKKTESPKITVTTYPLLLRKPTPNQTTKKKQTEEFKIQKRKKQHGTNPTIQPSPHTPKISPFISRLIWLQNSPRPSLWCLSLGWSAVNIPSRSTDGEDPQQGFPYRAVPKGETI